MSRAEPDFPADFLWGAATSAHQVEGGNVNNDWWDFEHDPRSAARESSADAIDRFHRYADDFALLETLDHNVHRLSVEWSRSSPLRATSARAALGSSRAGARDAAHRAPDRPVGRLSDAALATPTPASRRPDGSTLSAHLTRSRPSLPDGSPPHEQHPRTNLMKRFTPLSAVGPIRKEGRTGANHQSQSQRRRRRGPGRRPARTPVRDRGIRDNRVRRIRQRRSPRPRCRRPLRRATGHRQPSADPVLADRRNPARQVPPVLPIALQPGLSRRSADRV